MVETYHHFDIKGGKAFMAIAQDEDELKNVIKTLQALIKKIRQKQWGKK